MDDAVLVATDDPVVAAELTYEIDYNEMAKKKLGLGADDAADLATWAADYHWQAQRDAIAEVQRLRVEAAQI